MDIDDISSELESTYLPSPKEDLAELKLRESYWPMRIFRELDSRVSYAWDWCWEVGVSPLTLGTWSKGAWRSNPVTYLAYRVIRLIGVTLAPILGLVKFAHSVCISMPVNFVTTTDFFYFHGERRHFKERIHDFIHWNADLYAHLELFDGSGELPFIDRIDDVAKALKDHNSDIIFLSNVDASSASTLHSKLQENYADFFLDIGRRQRSSGSNMFIASRAELTSVPEYIVVDLSKEYGKKAGFFVLETPHQLFIATDFPKGDTGLKERLRTFFMTQIVDYLKQRDTQAAIKKEVFIVGDLAIYDETELSRIQEKLEGMQVKLQGTNKLLKIHLHPGSANRARGRGYFEHESVKHKYATINQLDKFMWHDSYHEKGESASQDHSGLEFEGQEKGTVHEWGQKEDKEMADYPSIGIGQRGERVDQKDNGHAASISARGQRSDLDTEAATVSSHYEGGEEEDLYIASTINARGQRLEDQQEGIGAQNVAGSGQREDKEAVVEVASVSAHGQMADEKELLNHQKTSARGQREDEELEVYSPSKTAFGSRVEVDLPADTSITGSQGQRAEEILPAGKSSGSMYGEREDYLRPSDQDSISRHGEMVEESTSKQGPSSSGHGDKKDESPDIKQPSKEHQGERIDQSSDMLSKNPEGHGQKDEVSDRTASKDRGHQSHGERVEPRQDSESSQGENLTEEEQAAAEQEERPTKNKKPVESPSPVNPSSVKPPFFR